ncbi:MAG: sensor histidine kinase [Pseudomonadota bacterium]
MNIRNPLGRSDARLAAVLEGVSQAYYLVDRDWRIVLFNHAAEAFFGRPRDEIVGQGLWEVSRRGRDSDFGRMMCAAMDKGEPGRMTVPSIVHPGRIAEIRVAPLGAYGVGVAAEDITERHVSARAVQESQERLDLAVGAHQIGIFDWDVPSGAAVWTAEMEEIFGVPRGGFEGHTEHFRRRVLPEDLVRIEAETAEALAAGKDLVNYEFRIVRPDGEIRWIEGAARFVLGEDGQPRRMVGTNIDITERKGAERRQQLLINELNHRVKNTLAIVQAIAWQSFRSGGMARQAREDFEGRLAALAAAHDVLTGQNWEAASMVRIVCGALAPHDPADGRITIAGPSIDLEPKTAVSMALAMHELATNAVKYGALSEPAGRVEIRWTLEEGALRLTWRESGGPAVSAPAQRGFGARLLEQGLAEELRGTVRLQFRPEGLVCEMEAPLAG